MSKALIITILLHFLFSKSNAQLIENFENGNITTNPVWDGDVANFSITGSSQLRLNAPTTLTSSYISTPLLLNNLKNNEWNISIRHNFASSATNRSRVYIASDVSTLSSTNLNGYYLQIGETGSGDVVSLFRQTGNTSTSLLRGITTIASAFSVDIKLTYSNSGLWEMYVKSTTSAVFGSAEASILDVTNNSANYFGIFINYTSTNRQNFWFDNITVTSLPDIYPPELQTVTALGLNVLELEFSEAISTATSTLLGNYLLNNTQNPTEISVVGINKVNLTFSGTTFSGSNTISVSGIQDLAGNTILPNSTLSFNFSIPIPPYVFSFRDIVINEIMADINPAPNGLPAVEYIEIYNTKSQTINLQNVILRDYASSGTFVNKTITGIVTIAGNGFLILCSNSAKSSLSGLNIPIYSFSTLDPSTEDKFEILDTQGNVIDQVEYFSSSYKNSSKSGGGWSLEQINPNTTCTGSNNWAASTSSIGGTPGLQNSIFSGTITGKKPTIISVKIVNLTQVGIRFSDVISPYSSQIIVSSTSLGIENVNSNADSVLVNITFPIDSGIVHYLQIKNIQNCEGQLLIDTFALISLPKKAKTGSIIFSEIYADETPSNGLPEGEFIEIYNSSEYVLDLSLYKLWDLTSAGTIPAGTTISPKSYLILSNTTNASLYSNFGKTVGVPSFPSLNATGDDISVRNTQGQTICSIKYSDSWYGNQNKQDGGWSLEKIDLNNVCESTSNWTASVDAKGGTPGKANSVASINPDLTSPNFVSAFAISDSILIINFDDILDSISVFDAKIYLSNNLQYAIQDVGLQDITLKINPKLFSKTNYVISVLGIKDCALNQQNNIQSKIFVLPEKAVLNDVLINEVLFNPRTGGADFVEVYNNSTKTINLKNWMLANSDNDGKIANRKNISLENILLSPKSYKVFTTDNLNIWNNYPKSVKESFVEMPTFPSFADNEGNVILLNSDSVKIDNFAYKDDFHYALLEDKSGISLERIRFDLPTQEPSNWQSAATSDGNATPGFKNSQSAAENTINTKILSFEPNVFTPDDDGWRDFTLITCQLPTNGYTISLQIFDVEGRLIKNIANNILVGTQAVFKWDGLDYTNKRVSTGTYMLLLEGFTLDGNKIIDRNNVVVGSKF